MKFSISRSELQNALGIVQKGVSSRSTLPVLSGVLVTAEDGQIILQTTNLELSVQFKCSALIEEEGSTVFPAKLLFDIVKNLPDAAVTIEANESGAQINCQNSDFQIRTLSAEDFPAFPRVDVLQRISLPFLDFSNMVKRVARVVSKDESRAILTGVLMVVEDGVLKMVATDSYRLAVTQHRLAAAETDFQAVISGTFLLDIASLGKSDENMVVSLTENQIVIEYQNTVFINRRIEGTFPNYKQLLPNTYMTRVGVATGDFVAAVKRTAILGSTTSTMKITVDPITHTMQLHAGNQELGQVTETIECEGEGELLEIAFNCSYVLDGLSAVETDMTYLELQSSMKPGILTAAEGEEYLYLIMPVRIS